MINTSEMNNLVDGVVDNFDFLLGEYPEIYKYLEENPEEVITFNFSGNSTEILINGKPFDFVVEN